MPTPEQAQKILLSWLIELHTLFTGVFNFLVLQHPLVKTVNPAIQDAGIGLSTFLDQISKTEKINELKSFKIPSIKRKIYKNGKNGVFLSKIESERLDVSILVDIVLRIDGFLDFKHKRKLGKKLRKNSKK